MFLKKEKGIIVSYVLVFGTIFLIMLSGLLSFVLTNLRYANQRVAWNESLEIAEAGIDYYRWCLNNEAESECLMTKQVEDAEGNVMGAFSLEVDSCVVCGETVSRIITCTGWTEKFPDVQRKINVVYGRESVGKYAYLLNDNVWAGSDREVQGLYHSNGGVRMDGENKSMVTSSQDEWICTSGFGCSSCPTDSTPACRLEDENCICPGVFTTTENAAADLFDSPVTPFDFDAITVDLAEIKSITQPNPLEYYWPESTDIDSNAKGYHLKFLNDGTFEVWIITQLQGTWGFSYEDDWHYDYFTIQNEYRYGNPISVQSNCPVLFFEDNLWVEGEINGKITAASANLIDPNQDTDIILSGNIDYVSLDDSNSLTLISQRNVLIPPNSPDQMEIRGIFIAQKGHFGRNHYQWNIKDKLEMYGSVVSNGRVGTQWTSGSSVVSGYLKRENYFDPNLLYNPSPYTPFINSQFKIIKWEEILL